MKATRQLISEKIKPYLLPTEHDEREVLGVGSIPVAILISCQNVRNNVLLLHKHAYSWVVKIRNTSEAVLGPQYSTWPSYGPRPYGPWSV